MTVSEKRRNMKYTVVVADDEKNPSLISNVVALHNASEKKPSGSHSVRDMKRLLSGHITSVFNIQIYISA